MAEPLRPAPAKAYGRDSWFYVPAGGFANYLAPTATELKAASVLNFTLIALASGTTAPTATTSRVTAERRVGDTVTYEYKGTKAYQGGTIVFSVDPQAVAASAGKKAWETFQAGPDGGFVVRRLNIARAVDATTGQFVTVFPADLSEPDIGTTGEGDSGEVTGTTEMYVTGPVARLVALT